MTAETYEIAQSIVSMLSCGGLSVCTAESCTGGGIAAALTAIPGSSAYVKGGVVAYTEEVKMRLLGVAPATLHSFGVVSRETVVEMARGAMKSMDCDYAVATSGVAGPSGGTEAVPVGTIWVAVVSRTQEFAHCIRSYDRGRVENTQHAILESLKLLQKMVEKE